MVSRVVCKDYLPQWRTDAQVRYFCERYGVVLHVVIGSFLEFDYKTKNNYQYYKANVQFVELKDSIVMFDSFSTDSHLLGKRLGVRYLMKRPYLYCVTDTRRDATKALRILSWTLSAKIVTIEALYSAFCYYGRIHRIATFDKATGFMALIEYEDVAMAVTAMRARNRNFFPRYLLPHASGECVLYLDFSDQVNLKINSKSFWTRDYLIHELHVIMAARSVTMLYAFVNFSGEQIEDNFHEEHVAFMGGMFAGLIRLDLNEDPLRKWVSSIVEASGTTEEEIESEGSKSNADEVPQ